MDEMQHHNINTMQRQDALQNEVVNLTGNGVDPVVPVAEPDREEDNDQHGEDEQSPSCVVPASIPRNTVRSLRLRRS